MFEKLRKTSIWMLLWIASNLLFCQWHEHTHQTIYGYYGINSTIRTDWTGLKMTTTPQGITDITPQTEKAEYQNIEVDVIGYQLQALINCMWILATAWRLTT